MNILIDNRGFKELQDRMVIIHSVIVQSGSASRTGGPAVLLTQSLSVVPIHCALGRGASRL